MKMLKKLCYFLCITTLTICDFTFGLLDGDILQNRPNVDVRSRLSPSQQHQILNDVQQHQQRYTFPSNAPDSSVISFPVDKIGDSLATSFPSLNKYQIDNTKQQLNPYIQTQFQLPTRNPFNFQNSGFSTQRDLNFFNDPATNLQLQSYYQKQRELEILRKQRDQLILEQQELKRQQELLRQQQLRALTSTTTPTPVKISTTTVSTTSTTTPRATTPTSILLPSPTARRITPAESEIFLKAIATHQKKFSSSTAKPVTKSTTPALVEDAYESGDIPKDLLSLIQAQNPQILGNGKGKPQIKIIYQTEKPKLSSGSKKSLEKDQLLRQLKLALSESVDEDERNITTRDLVLPNGRKLQIIQAPNGLSSIIPNEGSSQFQTVTQALNPSTTVYAPSTTTVRPAKAILEELTKGVLPPGTDFEVLRHRGDGKVEAVDKSPIQNQPNKKVTFVVLEEQPDGSYKVQGVKGNTENETTSDVNSIVEKIKKGELKLPSNFNGTNNNRTKNNFVSSTTAKPTTAKYSLSSSTAKYTEKTDASSHFPSVTVTPNSIFSTDNYVTSASTPSVSFFNSNPPFTSTKQSLFSSGSSVNIPRNNFLPTIPPTSEIFSSTASPTFTTTFAPRTSTSSASSHIHFSSPSPTYFPRTSPSTISSINSASENLILDDTSARNVGNSVESTINPITTTESISNILKREGLFAMAKYLRQSGLDSVLNETGPYTIFVPTDKAFRSLLVQLGGPEKAEQKFRENPRLLSGLLLHHVIPGAFRINSLQEEMTGVSLAGTQLRVNVYEMHDQEWNDVKVTTINGAKVSQSKRDIEIPQGIAHAVDRVMFPLPVGDLMQTLAADREQRFGIFLRILHAAGLDETLSGPKTFTIFAPTDSAFTAAANQAGRPVWIESDGPEAAKLLASKYIMPTTLYSSGMRYYHQKDTLRPQFTLRLQKSNGRIRVNDAQVVTNNVPATNGVIHAIDSLL